MYTVLDSLAYDRKSCKCAKLVSLPAAAIIYSPFDILKRGTPLKLGLSTVCLYSNKCGISTEEIKHIK